MFQLCVFLLKSRLQSSLVRFVRPMVPMVYFYVMYSYASGALVCVNDVVLPSVEPSDAVQHTCLNIFKGRLPARVDFTKYAALVNSTVNSTFARS